MLDEFCNKLPEATQVALAIRLIEIALPAWEDHVTEHPGDLKRVNKLITQKHYVQGGAHQVVKQLPRVALHELKETIAGGANLKENSILKGQLATIMEPLTLSTWDGMLPAPARLAFTAVFNLLTFLLFRRVNEANETTVYVSINQACDCILQKEFLSLPELERVLKEYEHLTAPALVGNVNANEKLPAPPGLSVGGMFASCTKQNPAHCPLCGSQDVSEVGGWYEFTEMHCNSCGYDQYCDDWQLDKWYA